MKSSQ
jgi:tRNA-dihydrouridine synthase A